MLQSLDYVGQGAAGLLIGLDSTHVLSALTRGHMWSSRYDWSQKGLSDSAAV